MAFDVFVAILECSDSENDEEGENDKSGRYGREFGEELENGYTSKKATKG